VRGSGQRTEHSFGVLQVNILEGAAGSRQGVVSRQEVNRLWDPEYNIETMLNEIEDGGDYWFKKANSLKEAMRLMTDVVVHPKEKADLEAIVEERMAEFTRAPQFYESLWHPLDGEKKGTEAAP
jgi:hypothetical protein